MFRLWQSRSSRWRGTTTVVLGVSMGSASRRCVSCVALLVLLLLLLLLVVVVAVMTTALFGCGRGGGHGRGGPSSRCGSGNDIRESE